MDKETVLETSQNPTWSKVKRREVGHGVDMIYRKLTDRST